MVHSRSLMLMAPRQLQWVEQDLPPLAAHDIFVETRVGAISIGSELPRYQGIARQSMPPVYPCMIGYESVGIVRARGPAVRQCQIGDRIIAFYGHRTHAIVQDHTAIAVPMGIDDQLALLTILTCDVAKGLRKVQPWIGESVLVAGAGAIGLLAIWMLQALGCRAIDVVEPRPARRLLASRLGARRTLSPEEAVTSGHLYPVGVECSSHDEAFRLLQAHMQPGGRICILADGNREPLQLSPAFHEKELQVVGSSDGWDYHAHAAWYFDILARGQPDLSQLFDLHIHAERLAETFEQLATGQQVATKVCVHYAN